MFEFVVGMGEGLEGQDFLDVWVWFWSGVIINVVNGCVCWFGICDIGFCCIVCLLWEI